MINMLKRKLISQAGESIGETLIALLISALALMMLAGAVSTGMRIVTNSKNKMDDYYVVNNAIVARDTTPPTIDGTAVADFSGEFSVEISNLLPSGATIPKVDYWKNEQLSGIPVITYTMSTI